MNMSEAATVSSPVLTQVSIQTEEVPLGRLSIPTDTPSCDLESPPGWITATKSDHEDGLGQAAASPSLDSVPQATIGLPHVSPSEIVLCQYSMQVRYMSICAAHQCVSNRRLMLTCGVSAKTRKQASWACAVYRAAWANELMEGYLRRHIGWRAVLKRYLLPCQ